MDITPQSDTQQPISDDQELAKALAGVLPDVPEPVVTEEAAPIEHAPQLTETPTPAPVTPTPATNSPNLEGVKKDALEELRPLIDKVDLPAEEKFDTYLMLIRSTDDSSLIPPAHVAAQGIVDETRRAQALLDIIKEIDYLSRNQS